ncbi:uncharacterized protein B0P05DRAFT_552279 [Gilbertella persicaria]|uniref:uncharacterized protein n=1 Tax=Gilbertella persicaria TaxID=101096 RepID=UPI00221EC6F5|nr:uncharacterized protein B0P05DRAFT_552279 [Gilbertella persicaria]KAI8067623.1 hypothetical protein B0P05DRAFT_552279 [Gilbertella persicaria]
MIEQINEKYTEAVLDYVPKRRRIIVCMDGTWETPEGKTNVFKFFNEVDQTPGPDNDWDYILDYSSGLGTHGRHPILGGLFGYGISRQILSAYRFISKYYRDNNDQIWLVGFSRGAFAVRSLTGMIYNVGLLPENKLSKADEAYRLYRNKGETSRPYRTLSVAFRQANNCRSAEIYFIGCFDTVGALGVPKLPWFLGGSTFYSLFLGLHGFHDTRLSPIVKHAYHAMSIHDQRAWFKVTPMHFSKKKPDRDSNQILEQVWFPGMHADVGGQEYGNKDNLLSCHSLHWMMKKARENGLKFKSDSKYIGPFCCLGNHRFFYSDSYKSSLIYRIMPREDRVIDKDELTGDYRISQLYQDGQFLSFLTQEQLDMYKSKTLQTFYQCLGEQLVERKGVVPV